MSETRAIVTAASGRTGRRARGRTAGGKVTWRRALARDWRLYTFLVLPVLFLLVFRYVPMIGNVIAFRRFRPGGSPRLSASHRRSPRP